MLLHGVYTQIGSPERLAFRGLALPIFEDLGDLKRQATELNNLGIDFYWEGEWANALDVYERSRALFERIGDVTSVAMAMNNIGEILSDQGPHRPRRRSSSARCRRRSTRRGTSASR